MVQGQNHLSSRSTNAGLTAAFGRIEGSELDLNITSTASALVSAADGVSLQVKGAESLVYTLRDPAQVPLVLYKPGDEIRVNDPGIIDDTLRVSQIEFSFDNTGPEWTVYFGSPSLTGQSAVNHAVGVLLNRFKQAPEVASPAAVSFTGGGGAPTVVIADDGSSQFSQSRADFVWGLTISAGAFQNLLDSLAGTRARILFTEGAFPIDVHLDVPFGIDFEGMGRQATRLQWGNDPDITFAGGNGLRHIQLETVAS